MLQSKFLRNKIDRQIKTNGQEFTFTRFVEDEYHQVSDEESEEIKLSGIFHTSNSYIQQETQAGAKTFSKQVPMILTLYEDGIKVKTSDMVIINGNKYKVNTINDVNNFGIAIDISLEQVQDEY